MIWIIDDLNTRLLRVCYSDVSVIQMFVIQIPTVVRKSKKYFLDFLCLGQKKIGDKKHFFSSLLLLGKKIIFRRITVLTEGCSNITSVPEYSLANNPWRNDGQICQISNVKFIFVQYCLFWKKNVFYVFFSVTILVTFYFEGDYL